MSKQFGPRSRRCWSNLLDCDRQNDLLCIHCRKRRGVSYLAQISGRTKAQTPKNRNPTRVLRRRSEACRAKGNTPWRRSPNFAKWRTTSTRGREHRVIRLQSKSSGSRPTTILKRPSNCGAAKITFPPPVSGGYFWRLVFLGAAFSLQRRPNAAHWSDQSSGMPCSSSFTVSVRGWRPSTMASTMSGARSMCSGRRQLRY
jgi:hypothetical protein